MQTATIWRPTDTSKTYPPVIFGYGSSETELYGGTDIAKHDNLLNEIASMGYVVIAPMGMPVQTGDEKIPCSTVLMYNDIVATGTFLIDSPFYSVKIDITNGFGFVGYKESATIMFNAMPIWPASLKAAATIGIEMGSLSAFGTDPLLSAS